MELKNTSSSSLKWKRVLFSFDFDLFKIDYYQYFVRRPWLYLAFLSFFNLSSFRKKKKTKNEKVRSEYEKNCHSNIESNT